MSEQTAEQVLTDLQAQAVMSEFRRDPYLHNVWLAAPPQDQLSLIGKVRDEAIAAGYFVAEMDKWFRPFLDKLYDDGKLPEIAKAQVALHQFAQAQEDHAIQNAPMSRVQQYLRSIYKDPATAAMHRERTTSTDDTEYPG